ncbi:MAG: hypothetical protein QNJ08_08255 [Crocosphaera sp.]|nr:hypothetical protein [Crocosphaera sp.]
MKIKTLKKEDSDYVCSVDLGINNAATCSIVGRNGTVKARKFINPARDIDRRNKRKMMITKKSKQTHKKTGKKFVKGFCQGLYRKSSNINLEISRKVSREIIEFAKLHDVKVIVIENLGVCSTSGANSMKLNANLVLLSLVTVGLSLFVPVKANAQLQNIGPNLSVPSQNCIPGAVNCGATTHRENMRHNRQLYFQTPEKILQHFHRERTERACLERTITNPPPAIDRNCGQYLQQIETLNQQDAVIDQRLLQQQEIDRLYPNVPR